MSKRRGLIIFFACLVNISFSQAPGCPNIDLGPDINVDCLSNCTTLTASVLEVGETTTYSVSSIPYNPPYNFNQGTPIIANTDDIFSPVMNLSFNFCFFNNIYSQIVVGSNGVISFDLSNANGYCQYAFTNTIPNTTGVPYRNAISGAYHDMNPFFGGSIKYAILGSYPCRTFVVNYNDVPHYSCNNTKTTQQIVLYETTNVIEVYIQNKPICNFNGGRAVIGIQNTSGTIGFTPNNRNTSQWNASNEAWRFTPDGIAAYTINWFENGVNIGSGDSISVCPTDTTIYDANVVYTKCDGSQITETDQITVFFSNNLSATINSSNISCNGANDGSATVLNIQNGTPFDPNGIPNDGDEYYLYQWDDALLQTTSTASNLSPGTYNCTITDSNNCTFIISVVITEPPPFNPSITTNNISCNGFANGSINVINQPITTTYLWSTGNTASSINNLSAGTYSVDVTDTNGCISTGFFTITEPSAIAVTETINNVSCYGGNDGSALLITSGGTLPHTYNWGTNNLSSLAVGTYSYTITDNNGCTYSSSINITSPSPISVSENINNISCFGLNDGSVNLSISGGIPTYTENWGANNPASLSFGTYSYTITDYNGCTYTDTVLISEPPEMQISSTQNNVSTCGATDGSINVTTLGGTPPYLFSWSSGQNTEDINSLSSGTFILTVTDANLCTSTHSVTLTEPISPIVSYIHTNTSCNLGNDGSIDISVSGGLNPYQYSWSNSATSQDIYNLSAGIYTLNVTDANNCIVVENITITEPTAVNVISTQTNVTNCNGNDGSIDISASGGTGNYTYLWSNFATTEDVFNLTSGIHSVNVTDANNCTFTFNFTITEPSGITATENITNVACFGENSGSVTINVIGGQPPYTENWNGYNPANLTAGIYIYTVTDNQNCDFTNSIIITEPQQLVVNENIINVLCKDENTGSATLNISGGTAPFNENWGIFNPNALYDGSYNYIVTDANGCTFNNQIIISEPDSLISNVATTDAVCFGYNDGTAIITTSGGTQPYNTNWFGQNNLYLTSGNYSALITDTKGCTNTINFSISEPSEISIIIDSFPTTCFGYSDGSALLTISGGIQPYNTNWFGQNPLALTAGNHNFEVTDSNNCVQQGIATIYEPTDITTNEIISDVLCNGDSNGTAFLQIFGGTAPYTENWNSVNITQLPKGNYNYTIIDANNCTFSDYVTINEPDSLSIVESVTDANCFNSNDGQAILTISGGTTPYAENWGSDNPFSLSAGVYYYTVTDLNSCSFSDSVIINQNNQVYMNFNMESPICIYDSTDMSINVINPISSTYTVEVNNGTITSYLLIDSSGNDIITNDEFAFSPNISTLFTVVSITDANGCNSPVNQTDSVIVNPLPVLNLDIPNFCTQDTSRIINQAIPTGGVYFIDNTETNFFDIENLEVATYNVRYEYTDLITGCFNTISTDIQINESPYADFAFGPQPANIDDAKIYFENKSDFYNYQLWNLGDGTMINQDKFSHVFSDTGSFFTQLYIENEYGCSDSITYEIIIYPVFAINIPSAFTPNDDGDNDRFGPFLRDGGYTSYNMKIFNHWGEIIFDRENTFWDGTLNNELCQHGTYTYTITAYDFLNKPHSRTGSFILIR